MDAWRCFAWQYCVAAGMGKVVEEEEAGGDGGIVSLNQSGDETPLPGAREVLGRDWKSECDSATPPKGAQGRLRWRAPRLTTSYDVHERRRVQQRLALAGGGEPKHPSSTPLSLAVTHTHGEVLGAPGWPILTHARVRGFGTPRCRSSCVSRMRTSPRCPHPSRCM